MVKEEGLALTSCISGMLGVTEPAMFSVNLPLKYPFIAAISTSCVLGAIVGMNNVTWKSWCWWRASIHFDSKRILASISYCDSYCYCCTMYTNNCDVSF